MAQQCPLLFRQVDSTVTRINTLFIILGVIGFLLTQNIIILILLIGDFFLRLYGYKHVSPIQNISLIIQKKLALANKMEDAGAKRLAAIFGVAFLMAMALFSSLHLPVIVNIIAGVYLSCAILDLFFGFCIACKIYTIGKKIYPKAFA